MSHPRRWCIALTLTALLALTWSTTARPADDPAGGPPREPAHRIAVPAAPAGLNDMLQPLPQVVVAKATTPARTDVDDAVPPAWSSVPLADRLAVLAPAQRANAAIELELASDASAIDRMVAARVQELWAAARYDEAVVELRAFEGAGGQAALSLAWKQPVALPAGALAATAGGGDVRIGTRTGGRRPTLEYDRATGAIYAVLGWGAVTGGEAYWTVNRSVDHGATWQETYAWFAGATGGLVDVSATMVSGYLYVGYVAGDVQNEYRLRRCVASTGASDATYGFKVVMDAGALTVREVEVVSNIMSTDNRLYCFAIQSDDAVRFFWAVSTTAAAFTENSPVGASARTGLDASWNPGFTAFYLHLAYAGTDGLLHVQRLSSGGWTDRTLMSAANVSHRTGVSISAYDDAVICAYEFMMDHGVGIVYGISYDGGATAFDTYNYVYEPDGTTIGSYQCPSVDAQDGHGTAIVATAECGEPDRAYYRKRSNYAAGLWETASQFNDNDVLTGTPTALAHVPVLESTRFSHGAVYFYNTTPYFDLPMLETADVSGAEVAARVWLSPPAPSPMRERALVRFTLPTAGTARLELFDVRGAKVATLAEGWLDAGTHVRAIDGGALGSGVYFCRLTAGAIQRVNRFVVVH